MRLFIAANLPEDVRGALEDNLLDLADQVSGRAVRPETLHVTLAFLGEVPDDRVDSVREALDCAAEAVAAFDMALDDYGFFGKRDDATLWQGFQDAQGLEALATEVRWQLDQVGVDYDRKEFRPHVTLMRRAHMADVELEEPYVDEGMVASVTLFQSELSPAGPTYTALHTAQLAEPFQHPKGPLLIVDADACPVTKECLAEARRAGVPVLLAGNATQNLEKHLRSDDPRSAADARRGFWAATLTAQMGADSADFGIVTQLQAGDVVVTQDIGLASMVLGRGAAAIGVRGRVYDPATIDSALFIRHEEKKVRRAGGRTQGPAAFTSEDRSRFARNLRRLLDEAREAAR